VVPRIGGQCYGNARAGASRELLHPVLPLRQGPSVVRKAELGSERSPDPTTIMVWNNMPAFSANVIRPSRSAILWSISKIVFLVGLMPHRKASHSARRAARSRGSMTLINYGQGPALQVAEHCVRPATNG